jgi:hypothetical protein
MGRIKLANRVRANPASTFGIGGVNINARAGSGNPTAASPFVAGVGFPSVATGLPLELTVTALSNVSVRLAVAAAVDAPRSVVAYQIERSLNGVSGWQTVDTPDPVAASEIPVQDTRPPTKYLAMFGSIPGVPSFNSPQAAFDSLVPGDVLCINGDTFPNRVVMTRNGSALNPIYIKPLNYNSRPTFDGLNSRSIVPGWNAPFDAGRTQLFSLQASNVVIDGINFINSPEGGILVGDAQNNGNFITAARRNLWWSNNRLIRCTVTGSETALRTIQVDGCEVIGCEFYDSQRNQYPLGTGRDFTWGSAVSFMGKNISMIESTVGRSSGEGIHCGIHIQFGNENPSGTVHIQVDKLILRNNRVFDCWSGPIYISNVDAAVNDPSIIEGNIVWMTNDTAYWYGGAGGYPQYGIDVGSESPRNDGNTAYGTNNFAGARNMIIRNNIVTGSLRCFRLATEAGQDTTNVKVLNNTFYTTTPGAAPGIAAVIESYANGQSNIVMQNNLVHDPVPERGVRNWQTPGGTWERGYNLFPQAPPAALVAGTNVIAADPGMVNPTYRPAGGSFVQSQIKLVPGSPAANAGVVLAEVPTDSFGNPRQTYSGRYDIGAHAITKPLSMTFTDTGLTPGTTYFYRARLVQDDGTASIYDDKNITL